MDADDHPIETILAEGRCFIVPLYQRKYQWGDDRILPFWEDIEAKASEVLAGESKFQHYMGALILAPIGESAQIGITPRVQVVDGQQRLTTFQLFLAAVREVARIYDCKDIIAYVEDYLFNPLKSKDVDPLTKFKLSPTPSDRKIFHDILEKEWQEVRSKYGEYYWGDRVPKSSPQKALRAYEVFREKIKWFVLFESTDDDEENLESAESEGPNHANENLSDNGIIEARLEALLKAVLNRMKLVVITLGEDDDAQVIFETLNSKGEPLLAMDLVRNNIFYRAEKEGAAAEALYKELWDPFDNTWWRESAPNARPKRPRIDHFLSHILTAETGEKISMRELYAEYRAFAVPKGKPRFARVEEELKLLEKYSPIYETLESRIATNETLVWLGRKLAAWQITTAYPIAMQIFSGSIDEDERKELARLIYSYIVRRALSNLTSKNLNQVFQALSQFFVRRGVSVSTFVSFFVERSGESTRFPDDEEFRRGILSEPAYHLAPGSRIKDVLWELELASRTSFSEKITMPEGLQVEHVLPVTWAEEWPFPEGDWVDMWSGDPRAIQRNQLLHTLGNLTLISGGLNSSSGNKSFSEKKKKFEEHTGLFLNKWFLKRNEWSENEIRERGADLASKAVNIWVCLNNET